MVSVTFHKKSNFIKLGINKEYSLAVIVFH